MFNPPFREEAEKRVQKVSSIEKVKTNVDKETGDRIREYNLAGVKVDEDFKRYYPYGNLASRVLGFTGGDNQGIIGLEVKYEEILKGINGRILTTTDARGIELNGMGDAIERHPHVVVGKKRIVEVCFKTVDVYFLQTSEACSLNADHLPQSCEVNLAVVNGCR